MCAQVSVYKHITMSVFIMWLMGFLNLKTECFIDVVMCNDVVEMCWDVAALFQDMVEIHNVVDIHQNVLD